MGTGGVAGGTGYGTLDIGPKEQGNSLFRCRRQIPKLVNKPGNNTRLITGPRVVTQ